MEPFRYVGAQTIRGQEWIAAKWQYFIDKHVFDPMVFELMRELPDEYIYSKKEQTIYIKKVAITMFESIVNKHIEIPPSLTELEEAFSGAGKRGTEIMKETGYDNRGQIEEPERPLTHYLDTPVYHESAKAVDESIACGDCAKVCKNEHGLAIHRSRTH